MDYNYIEMGNRIKLRRQELKNKTIRTSIIYQYF